MNVITLLSVLSGLYAILNSKFENVKNTLEGRLDKIIEQNSSINAVYTKKLLVLEEKIVQLSTINSKLADSLQNNGIKNFFKLAYNAVFNIPKEVVVVVLYVSTGLILTVYLTYIFKASFFYSVCASISCFIKNSLTLVMQKENIITTKMLMEQLEQLQSNLFLLTEHLKSILTSNLLVTKDFVEAASNGVQEAIINSNNSLSESTKIGFKTILEDLTIKDQMVKDCLEELFKQNIRVSDETVNVVVQSVTSSINKDIKNSTFFILDRIANSSSYALPVPSSSLITQVMESSNVNGFDFAEKVIRDLEPAQIVNLLAEKYF